MVAKAICIDSRLNMSTEKKQKQPMDRAKTSMGLKTFQRERLDTVSDLLEALEKERQMERVLMRSVDQWSEIIDEITTSMDSVTPTETEWKTRFHYQRLFNQMLNQQIGHIKTELYMLRQGHAGLTLPVMGHAGKSPRQSAGRENQAYINSLEEKLKSLESLYNMYEHQRDDASREYHRLKEEINHIAKDVWFNQKTKIKHQEESDSKEITRSRRPCDSGKLRRTGQRHMGSYLQLHSKSKNEALASKAASTGPSQKVWKTVAKSTVLPPIENKKHKIVDSKISKETPSNLITQKTWENVTLPPIENGKRNEKEDHASKVSAKEKVLVAKADPKLKLTCRRSERIAGLGDSKLPAIRRGRAYGGFVASSKPTEPPVDASKKHQPADISGTGSVYHVDEQKSASVGGEDGSSDTEGGCPEGGKSEQIIGAYTINQDEFTQNGKGDKEDLGIDSRSIDESEKKRVQSTFKKSPRKVERDGKISVDTKSPREQITAALQPGCSKRKSVRKNESTDNNMTPGDQGSLDTKFSNSKRKRLMSARKRSSDRNREVSQSPLGHSSPVPGCTKTYLTRGESSSHCTEKTDDGTSNGPTTELVKHRKSSPGRTARSSSGGVREDGILVHEDTKSPRKFKKSVTIREGSPIYYP